MGIFGNSKEGSKHGKETEAGGQHRDPVCGMLVVEAEAVGPDTYHGEVYWFCGEGCQGTFQGRQGAGRGQEQGQKVAR